MKKRDIILICAILAVAIIAIIAIELFKEDGAYVLVRIDGKDDVKYSLSVDGVYELNGGTNVLKIENGEAWMIEANCPTQGSTRCTYQGKISKTLETITCEYNKITVIVYGADEEADLLG